VHALTGFVILCNIVLEIILQNPEVHMECRRVAVLGDSILKGIQVEQDTGKYVTLNNIDVPALESRFGLQIQITPTSARRLIRAKRFSRGS
jgi:hypothetical protein